MFTEKPEPGGYAFPRTDRHAVPFPVSHPMTLPRTKAHGNFVQAFLMNFPAGSEIFPSRTNRGASTIARPSPGKWPAFRPTERLAFSSRLEGRRAFSQHAPVRTGDDSRQIALHGQRDPQQRVQTGALNFLLDVTDGLPGNARFPGERLERKVALFALRFQNAGHLRADGVRQFVIRHRVAIPKMEFDL